MTRHISILCALATLAAPAAQTVPSPLGSADDYVFTIPYCGTNGIRGRLMSLTATNAPIRVEDRAFLAEAEWERRFYAAPGTTQEWHAVTNYSSRWRFYGGEYELVAAYSRTNATYRPTVAEAAGPSLAISDLAAALGTDISPVTNATLRLAANPTNRVHLIAAGPVKAAYTNFGPFRVVAGISGTGAEETMTYREAVNTTGRPLQPDSHQSSTQSSSTRPDVNDIETIYNRRLSASSLEWTIYVGGESSWSVDRQGEISSDATYEYEAALEGAFELPIYATNATMTAVRQTAVVFPVTLYYAKPQVPDGGNLEYEQRYYAVAAPATLALRPDAMYARLSLNLATLRGQILSAAQMTVPDLAAVRAAVPPATVPPPAPQGPPIEDMTINTYGDGREARASISITLGVAYLVADIIPRAMHPQVPGAE